jgi:4-diphosphocytidyl-2-C-methyl-D-erythritol kinase
MATPLVYRAYAKVNLYLDVRNQRRDGYHNIETIFQSVGLADELTFNERQSRISLTCSTSELDTSDQNLVVRAARLLRQRSGSKTGVRIHLEKAIPIAAGLGGGSSDAAATLIALNLLWDLQWPLARLRLLARELGADVPYCTAGGTAAATGRGDDLRPLAPLFQTWFVLVHPDATVSTARVYGGARLTHNEEKSFAGITPSFRGALRALQTGRMTDVVFNRMEAAVFPDHPYLAEIKRRLLEQGCIAAGMSGSGATLFGVCPSRERAARIAESISDCRTSVVPSVPACVERIV